MKKVFLVFLLWGQVASLLAQSEFWNKNEQFIIKFAPFKTIDFDQNISFSAEYKTYNNTSYNLQLDYFFASWFELSDIEGNTQYYKGFRVTPEYRWYKEENDKYLGLQTSFKYVDFRYSDWFTLIASNSQTYDKFMDIRTNKFIWATHFLLGIRSPLETGNIGLDYNIGIGFRYRDINTNRPPELVENFPNEIEIFRFLPSIVANLKLTFAIKNNRKN